MGGKDDGGSGATLGKRMHTDGKEYDYLFDIDMNGAPMKIPFNRGMRVQYTQQPSIPPPFLTLLTRTRSHPIIPQHPVCGHHQATTLG